MREIEEKRKQRNITLTIVLCIISIILIFPINSNMFHKDEVSTIEGHYESRVYVTPTGDCYHHPSCSYITIKYEVGLEQAKGSGYSACEHCNGRSSGSIYIEGTAKVSEYNNYLGSTILSFIGTFSIGVVAYAYIWNQYEKELAEYRKDHDSLTST